MQEARVYDLDRARSFDPARTARRRLAAARRASGLSPAEFAGALDRLTRFRVNQQTVTTWETDSTPPGDVLVAAEHLAGTNPIVEPIRAIRGDAADLDRTRGAVVAGARSELAVTGSRSRDPEYLASIERVLMERPDVVLYRVLYGPPRHGAIRNHLVHLVDMQRPGVHIGICRNLMRDHERFIVASESEALVVGPSLRAPGNFDSGTHYTDPDDAAALVDHARQAWMASDQLTDRASIEKLEVV